MPQKKLLLLLGVFLYSLLHLLSVRYLDNAAEYTFLPPATADELLIPQDRMTVIGDPDGVAWVIHAQEAESQGLWRSPRFTYTDNHPYGRYVGWHSINTLWLRLLGHLRAMTTGEEVLPAIARAAAYSNAAYLLLFALPVGYLAIRLWSTRGAFLYPIFILLAYNPRMGLRSPDHHMLTVLVFLVTILALLVAARSQSRKWWIITGLCQGIQFWVSPLSAVIVTVSIVVAFPFLISRQNLPDLKRLLAMNSTTAAVILLAYVYEFAPDFQNHLEIVHPIYAVCILLATFYTHQWCQFYHHKFDFKILDKRLLLYPSLVLAAVCMLVIYNLNNWYTPSNLFLKRWMHQISESKALNLKTFLIDPTWCGIVLVLTILSALELAKNWKENLQSTLLFNLGLALVILAFAISQQRVTDFIWVPISILILSTCSFQRSKGAGTALSIVLAILVFSSFSNRISSANTCRRSGDTGVLSPHIVRSYNLRIRAQELLKASPDPSRSLLTTSGLSIYLKYYTKKPVFGTFYWENYDGNMRALHMLYRRKDPDTGEFPFIHEFLSSAKVDDILVDKNNLNLAFSYAIFGEDGRIRHKENAFIGYLQDVEEEDLPDWLSLKLDNDHIRLFEVTPLSEEQLEKARVPKN